MLLFVLQLAYFRSLFASDPNSYFEYFQPKQINYVEIQTTLCVGGVYLDAYLSGADFQAPLNVQKFVSALVVSLKGLYLFLFVADYYIR